MIVNKDPSESISNGAEDDVWSELPEDVVASIQARLPLISLVRSRDVCKGWDAAVAAPWLWQERLELRGGERERMLCVLGWNPWNSYNYAIYAYNRASNCWYNLEAVGEPWTLQPESPRQVLYFPCEVSAGGILVSFSNLGEKEIIPHISNPVTGSRAFLPAMPGNLEFNDILGVFVDPITHCVKIVALNVSSLGVLPTPGRERMSLRTYVFDSKPWSWSLTSSALPTPELVQGKHGVFVGTVLYCVALGYKAGSKYVSHNCNLLAYDLERASWSWLEVAKPRKSDMVVFYLILMNVRERLMCAAIGLHRKSEHPELQVWEMNFARMAWTVLDARMPRCIYTQLLSDKCFPRNPHVFEFGSRFQAVAGEDLEVYILHERLDKAMALDLRKMPPVWRWLPPWPYHHIPGKSLYCVDPWLQFGSCKQQVV